MFQPWIQRRRLAYAKHKHVISGILKHLKMRALGRLCTDEGTVDEEVLKKYVVILLWVTSIYLTFGDLATAVPFCV